MGIRWETFIASDFTNCSTFNAFYKYNFLWEKVVIFSNSWVVLSFVIGFNLGRLHGDIQ